MTTSLRSTMQVQLGWTWRDSTGGHAVVNSNRLHAGVELEGGAGVGEADAVWDAVNQSLSAGSSMVLSLDALARPLFGDTITVALSRVKTILIVNRNTSGSGYLVLGDAGENA